MVVIKTCKETVILDDAAAIETLTSECEITNKDFEFFSSL